MAGAFVSLETGYRTFDRAAFDEAFAHLDPLERKYRLRHEVQRFNTRHPIPSTLRAAVYERDGHTCVECGSTERLSLDHIHPYSRGGEDTYENLRTLCLSCNCRKGDRAQ